MTEHSTTETVNRDRRLAASIAMVMRTGTIIASALLVAGVVCLYLLPGPAVTVLFAGGCGLLVLVPVTRLAMMIGHFARLRDTNYVLITLAVLALVIAGGVIGLTR